MIRSAIIFIIICISISIYGGASGFEASTYGIKASKIISKVPFALCFIAAIFIVQKQIKAKDSIFRIAASFVFISLPVPLVISVTIIMGLVPIYTEAFGRSYSNTITAYKSIEPRTSRCLYRIGGSGRPGEYPTEICVSKPYYERLPDDLFKLTYNGKKSVFGHMLVGISDSYDVPPI